MTDVNNERMLFCLAKFFLGEMPFEKRYRHPGSVCGEKCVREEAEILSRKRFQ